MNLLRDADLTAFMGLQESQDILPASDFTPQVKDFLANGPSAQGDLLPWHKTHRTVRLQPAQVSVWGGINGHGKSMLVGFVMLHLLLTQRVLIASMEMSPMRTMARLVRQAAGCRDVDPAFVDQFSRFCDGRLWLYDQVNTVPPERILAVIHYGAKELGCRHIVIDNLALCGLPSDGPGCLTAQKEFVAALCYHARALDTHIHLVHHVRKSDRETRGIDKFDLRGAGEISDLADNVFLVHRNKAKENAIQAGEQVEPEVPDATLTVAKQRHGEWEGRILLWFDPDSQQYLPSHSSGPSRFAETAGL